MEEVKMKPKAVYSAQTEEVRVPPREHCPNCCHYLDGVKDHYTHPDGELRFMDKGDADEGHGSEWHWKMQSKFGAVKMFPQPGYQHHRHSTGTIYQRIGYVTPCTCHAGRAAVENRRRLEGK
jgi:hypothetical protein